MTLVLSREEVSNLMACIDTTMRAQGLASAETLLALAAKVSRATPISGG